MRFLALAFLGAAVVHPWLLDWAARSVLRGKGISVGSSRAGYAGIAWNEVRWDADGVALSLDALELAPWWELLGLAETDDRTLIRAKALAVRIGSSRGGEPSSADRGPREVIDLIDRVHGLLERWLPSTRIDGVDVSAGSGHLLADHVRWLRGRLETDGLRWTGGGEDEAPSRWSPPTVQVVLERTGSGAFSLRAVDLDERSMRVDLVSVPADGAVQATASIEWADGHLTGRAHWLGSSWRPTEATVDGASSGLPAGIVEQDFAAWRPQVSGHASYHGESGKYALDLEATGTLPATAGRPRELPWSATTEAQGDRSTLSIGVFSVDLPGVRASLSEPLELELETLQPARAVELDWALDLAAAPLEGWEGSASGTLSLEPEAAHDGARFRLHGTVSHLRVPSTAEGALPADFSLDSAGRLAAAAITLETLELRAPDWASIDGSAVWNRDSGRVDSLRASGTLEAQGLAQWVEPTIVTLGEDGVAFELEAAETAAGWSHRGRLSASNVFLKESWGAGVEFDWEGTARALSHWHLALTRPAVALEAEGALALTAGNGTLRLDRLEETRPEGEPWSLLQPVTVSWHAATVDDSAAVAISPLSLAREGGGSIRFEGHWGGWSEVELRARVAALRPGDALPWLEVATLPELSASALEVRLATIETGRGGFAWIGEGTLDATWTSPRQRRWKGTGGWSLENRRLSFRDLRLETEGTTWLHLNGAAPVGLRGDADGVVHLEVDRSAPLGLTAEMQPVERLPQPLEERLPFIARSLRAELRASGSIDAPTAQVSASADSLVWRETPDRGPVDLRDLHFSARVLEDRIDLEELSLRLAETAEAHRITGQVSSIDWPAWIEDPRVDRWLSLAGNLHLEAWPMSAFGRFLPDLVEPTGTVTVALSKDPGAWPEGDLVLRGLASRPFADGLVARQIDGTARLAGRRLDAIVLSGTIGGQPWNLEGWIDASSAEDPRFHLNLEAARLDLVRRADMVLRARASIEAVHENLDTPPLLRGEVQMLRSLWLRNLEDFTRQGASGVSMRPPYFAVTEAPWRDWQLDLRLEGEDFLQIRSTVLVGEASADFQLRGTLGDPLLTGQAWVNRGSILFPFAKLPAGELRARITAEDPHSVRLSGVGEGVAYGYVVQYQLSGTAEEPLLRFSSVPSLAQDEILLMVATGAVPATKGTSNATERAGRLALYLGQDFFSELIGQEGASRLEIRSGEGFSPFRREGQVIEYQLDDRWSILGEYDDFGGYNVDLKRKLLSR